MRKLGLNARLLGFINTLIDETGEDFYIVGGFVRDYLLNWGSFDIDLVTPVKPSRIVSILDTIGQEYTLKNRTLGVISIRIGKYNVDIGSMRLEKYKTGGEHHPVKVTFTKSVKKDSKRRDFTINSIYYNVRTDKYIDYHNGINDLEYSILKTVGSSVKTFKYDGERVLRLFRMASKYNLTIDNSTLSAAKRFRTNLERINDALFNNEIKKIISLDLSILKRWFNYLLKYSLLPYFLDKESSCRSNSDDSRLVSAKLESVQKIDKFIFLAFNIVQHCCGGEFLFKDDIYLQLFKNNRKIFKNNSEFKCVFAVIKQIIELRDMDLTNYLNVRKFIFNSGKKIKHIFVFFEQFDSRIYDILIKEFSFMKSNSIPLYKKEINIDKAKLKAEMEKIPTHRRRSVKEKVCEFILMNTKNNNEDKIIRFIRKEK